MTGNFLAAALSVSSSSLSPQVQSLHAFLRLPGAGTHSGGWMMGLVKSLGSRRVDSSIMSVEFRVRKSRRFLGFEDAGRLRRRGTAAVDTGFTKIVYHKYMIKGGG